MPLTPQAQIIQEQHMLTLLIGSFACTTPYRPVTCRNSILESMSTYHLCACAINTNYRTTVPTRVVRLCKDHLSFFQSNSNFTCSDRSEWACQLKIASSEAKFTLVSLQILSTR